MRECSRDALLSVLRSLNGEGETTYRVLVLDHRATRVMSASLRMFDITQEGVALVESLEKVRQPFTDMEVVYIVAPEAAAVAKIVADFPAEGTPRYGGAHIFFLTTCPPSVFDLIKSHPTLVSKVKTLTEINMNYLAVEENVFHLDMEGAMVQLFNAGGEQVSEASEKVVDGLVSFCATLHEYPFVRYSATSPLCNKIAMEFQEKLNQFVSNNSSFRWRGDGTDGNGDTSSRATMLLLDRSADPTVPLLHVFTYQAMVCDLLNVHNGVCRYFKKDLSQYKNQDEDPDLLLDDSPDPTDTIGMCLLNEDDPLWTEFRHLHITKVIERLKTHLEKFAESSIGKMNRTDKNTENFDLEQMNRAIQELPEYQEMMEKHSQHLQITRLCMHKLTKMKLLEIAKVEQVIATGVNEHGEAKSASAVTNDFMALVRDPLVNVVQTARLIGLYIIHFGLKEQERKLIFDGADPPLPLHVRAALFNLAKLGVTVELTGKAKRHRNKEKLTEAKRLAQTCEDAYGRYLPEVASTLDKFLRRRLSQETFPYVVAPPMADMASTSPTSSTSTSISSGFGGRSLGGFGSSIAAAFTKKKSSSSTEKESPTSPNSGIVLSMRRRPASNTASTAQSDAARSTVNRARKPVGSRVIVFVVGGITPAEMAQIHNVMREANRDVIIGSSHIITPKAFMHDLEYLENNRAKEWFEEKAQFQRAKERAQFYRQKASERANEGAGHVSSTSPTSESKSANAPRRKSFFNAFGCGCMSAPPPPTGKGAPPVASPASPQ